MSTYLKVGLGLLAGLAAAHYLLDNQAADRPQPANQQPLPLQQPLRDYLTAYTGVPSAVRSYTKREAKPDVPGFLGVGHLKQKQKEQLAQFEGWAKKGDWKALRSAHYDWWMFPINRTSQGQGSKYTVTRTNIEALWDDRQFMQDYRRGVHLCLLGWGWDTGGKCAVSDCGQWDGYDIRLHKILTSLELFEQTALLESVKTFAKSKISEAQANEYLKPILYPAKN